MAVRFKSLVVSAGLATGLLLVATACRAEAATPAAPAAQPCGGPSPVAGVEIRGPVLHVIDGETLCVALGFETDTWIKLRIADMPPPPVRKTSTAGLETNPRGALMQVAMARMADCKTVKDDAGEVAALCTIEGRPIGEALRDTRVQAASYSWR